MTADEHIGRPKSDQQGPVERHDWRKPDQPQEAEIRGMSAKAINTDWLKFATRKGSSANPIPPGGQPRLIAKTCQTQAVKEQDPRAEKSDLDERPKSIGPFPNHD